MDMLEVEGTFILIDIGVLHIAMGGFWSTMDMDMEERGMLGRTDSDTP